MALTEIEFGNNVAILGSMRRTNLIHFRMDTALITISFERWAMGGEKKALKV